MDRPKYLKWIIKENGIIENSSIPLKCYKIDYNNDSDILDNWALHIRRHYISDNELQDDCTCLGITPEKYLKNYIIPKKDEPLGSTARSNTITEILISDLLEFIFGYNVPRIKQRNMSGTTVSEHGTDVIGYFFENRDKTPSNKDKLVAAEVKAVLSKTDTSVIKNAVVDSRKDEFRISLTLNYLRKKLKKYGMLKESKDIERFQHKTDYDYSIIYIPAGITSLDNLESISINGNEVQIIPNVNGRDIAVRKGQCIFFLHGKTLMKLTHEVYERCTK